MLAATPEEAELNRRVMAQAEEMGRRGEAWYEKIRAQMEAEHKHEYLAIDIDTGEHELGNDLNTVGNGLRHRRPGTLLYIVHIGHIATGYIGGIPESEETA